MMESFIEEGKVKQIGLSNCYDPEFFKGLFLEVKVKPSVLQNRFYQDSGYDKELRAFCQEQGVFYQCFWTVNANLHIWESPYVIDLANKLGKSPIQVYFRALIQDQIHLYETTSSDHMAEVMELLDFSLDSTDLVGIRKSENIK